MKSRILALVLGPFYLLFCAVLLTTVVELHLLITIPLVVVGALTIMVTLGIFGVKSYQHKTGVLRFSLSTIFLLIIPLSVYLAGIRLILRSVPTHEFGISGWLGVTVVSVFFIFISTGVLLCLGEALVWFAVAVRRGSTQNTSGLVPISLEQLSEVQYSAALAPHATFEKPEFLYAAFRGAYRSGSAGSPDATYIMAVMAALDRAWRPDAFIVDLSELTYTSGDEMRWIWDLGSQTCRCRRPLAVIAGDGCRHALLTLNPDEFSRHCADTFHDALTSIRLQKAEYDACIKELPDASRPNRVAGGVSAYSPHAAKDAP